MAEFYRAVHPSFWTGATGKFLKGKPELQVLAMYLITNKHSDMKGVYHLPIDYICADTGLSKQGAMKGLASLYEGAFCEYFYDQETVFVYNMLSFQIVNLKNNDNRVKGVINWFEKEKNLYIKQRFAEVYGATLGISFEASTKPLASPPQAPTVTEAVTETEAEAETDTEQHTPTSGDDGFKEFWEAYPKKVGKGSAIKIWAKLKVKPLDEIIAALKWQRYCEQWQKDNGQYIPNPATYLNQQRWLDEEPLPTKMVAYETPYQKSMRERVESITPNIARKVSRPFNPNFLEDIQDVITDQSN